MEFIQDKTTYDKDRVEVTLRIGIGFLIGFSMAIADIPTVVPPSFTYLMGSLIASLLFALPKYVWALPAVTSAVFAVMIVDLAVASAFLAAAHISDGLLLGLYSIFTFISTGLFFGKTETTTNSIANVMIVIPGMLALSLRGLVQDGFSFTVSTGTNIETVETVVRVVLSVLCLRLDQETTCWEDAPLYLPRDGSSLEIDSLPDSAGMFSGQKAYVSAVTVNETDLGLQIDIPGGLWLISGFWTWKGTENPLAIYRNFLIVLAWVVFIWIFSVAIPPIRTIRNAIAQVQVPDLLNSLAKTAEKNSTKLTPDEHNRIVHGLSQVTGGSQAAMTVFEPRLCSAAPLQNAIPQLKELMICAEEAVVRFLFVRAVTDDENRSDHWSPEQQKYLRALGSCAKALVSKGDADLQVLKELQAAENKDAEPGRHFDASRCVREGSEKMIDATLVWVDVILHPVQPKLLSKEGLKSVILLFFAPVVPAILPFPRYVFILLLPLQPKKWCLETMLYSLELALGFVALFAASLYWDKYADFAIQTNLGTSGAVFSGWQLCGYAFSWQVTMEGTVKKGTQRAAGTALGGFMAWLAIIVCSGSFDDDAPVNKYGLTAWLTVTSIAAAYLCIDKGETAREGATYDFGYTGTYFLAVQALIALEVLQGNGSKNALVANRVVATVAGVVMAMFLCAIPPHVSGNDPKHTGDFLSVLKSSFVQLLKATLDGNDGFERISKETFKTDFLMTADATRKRAAFYLKDAGRLKGFPFFQVDERLGPLLEDMRLTQFLVGRLYDVALKIPKDILVDELSEETSARYSLESVVKEYTDDISENTSDKEFVQGDSEVDLIALFISSTYIIDKRLRGHEAAFKDIVEG